MRAGERGRLPRSIRAAAGAIVLALALPGSGEADVLVDQDFEDEAALAAWRSPAAGDPQLRPDPHNQFDQVLAVQAPAKGHNEAMRTFDPVVAADFASYLEVQLELLVASPFEGPASVALIDVEGRTLARLRVALDEDGDVVLHAYGRRSEVGDVATREPLARGLALDRWSRVTLRADLRDRHFDAILHGGDGPDATSSSRIAQRIFFLSNGSSASALRIEASDGSTLLVDEVRVTTGATGNLIRHGAFEEMEEGLPLGWQARGDPSGRLSLDTDTPFEGRASLRIHKPDASSPRFALLLDPVAIAEGHYRVRYRYRLDANTAADTNAVAVSLHFFDDRDTLVGSSALGARAEATSRFWRAAERDVQAPPGATRLEVVLGLHPRFVGTVAIDDLEIRPLPEPRLTPPTGSFAFDFVAPGERATPGFSAVAMDDAFEAGARGDFGWDVSKAPLSPARTILAAGPYPSFLQSRSVTRATFRADVPDGRYHVSLFAGALRRVPKHDLSDRFVVNGEVVEDPRPGLDELMDERYFAFVRDGGVDEHSLGRAGHQIFDRFIAPRFHRHDVEVEVSDGLVIEVDRGYLAAVVATPIAAGAEHTAAVDDLSAQLRESFVATFAERAPTRTARGARRGRHLPEPQVPWVLFRRHWMTAVEHDSRPDPDELATELALRAAPGEYEPVTFSIWPRRPLEDVRIEVSDLEGPEGQRIPASAVRTWALAHKPLRRTLPATVYSLEGTFLPDWHDEDGRGRDLHRDLVQRVWLSAQAPADAAPGRYTGKITVRTSTPDVPDATLPLTIEVRDFALVRPDRVHVMRYGANSVLVPYPEAFATATAAAWEELGSRRRHRRTRELFRKRAVEDLRAHGFRPELKADWRALYDPASGEINWNKRWTEGHVASAANLLRADPSAEGERRWVDAAQVTLCCLLGAFEPAGGRWSRSDVAGFLTALYRDLGPESEQSFGGAPGIFLHGSAEETKYDGPDSPTYRAWLAYLRFVRDGDADHDPRSWGNDPDDPNDHFIRSVHTFNTAGGHGDTVPQGLVGMPYLGPFHGAVQRPAAEQIRDVPDGSDFGLYGAWGRFHLGYYLWRTGIENQSSRLGVFHEFYNPYYGLPSSGWDQKLRIRGSRETFEVFAEGPDWFVTTVAPDGRAVGTWFWEELREGVDDDAYLHTLRHWIEATADDPRPEVRAARDRSRALLRDFVRRVALEPERTHWVPLNPHSDLYRPVSVETMDAWREELAAATSALVAASR